MSNLSFTRRLAGIAITPMSPQFYAIQAACGLVSLITAWGWARSFPGGVHRVRFGLIAVGLALVVGLEFMGEVIYYEKQFNEMIGAEIMAEIPPLTTAEEEIARQRHSRFEWAAAGAISFVLLMGVAFSFLRG